jgi:hypothetical protein
MDALVLLGRRGHKHALGDHACVPTQKIKFFFADALLMDQITV